MPSHNSWYQSESRARLFKWTNQRICAFFISSIQIHRVWRSICSSHECIKKSNKCTIDWLTGRTDDDCAKYFYGNFGVRCTRRGHRTRRYPFYILTRCLVPDLEDIIFDAIETAIWRIVFWRPFSSSSASLNNEKGKVNKSIMSKYSDAPFCLRESKEPREGSLVDTPSS